MQRGADVRWQYAPFYNDIALHPETGRFRRFGAQLAKKLYDDTEEVLLKEAAVNTVLAGISSDRGVTVLDIPRNIVDTGCAENPEAESYLEIKEKWTHYEESLMKYCQTLCLSQQVINLPHQAPYAAVRLSDHSQVFDGNLFGPTSEQAHVYRGPSHHTDTCSWRGLLQAPLQGDLLTTLVLNHGKWIEKHILGRLRRLISGPKHVPAIGTNMQYNRIVDTIDTIACVFVPLLLTAGMFALAEIGPIRIRTSVVGVFGLIFSLAVKALAGHPTRGEVFTANAAFFAVASVFIGSTGCIGADQ